MNFIKHFRAWLDRVTADDRLDALHVSLYLALFSEWNRQHFRTPMTIFRTEIMLTAKIRSPNTYTRCLRQLDDWGYIRYEPSHNPRQGSRVHLFRFEKGSDTGDEYSPHKNPDNSPNNGPRTSSNNGPNNSSDDSRDTGSDTTTDNGSDKGLVRVVIPYNINVINSTNRINDINAYGTTNENSDFVYDGKADTHPSATGPGSHHRQGQTGGRGRPGPQRLGAVPGSLEEAQAYFLEIHSTAGEAEKFFNHFQSNGWQVGGRSPMKDWRAAARNWVINSPKFAHDQSKQQPRPGKLNAGPKNYSEPL